MRRLATSAGVTSSPHRSVSQFGPTSEPSSCMPFSHASMKASSEIATGAHSAPVVSHMAGRGRPVRPEHDDRHVVPRLRGTNGPPAVRELETEHFAARRDALNETVVVILRSGGVWEHGLLGWRACGGTLATDAISVTSETSGESSSPPLASCGFAPSLSRPQLGKRNGFPVPLLLSVRRAPASLRFSEPQARNGFPVPLRRIGRSRSIFAPSRRRAFPGFRAPHRKTCYEVR
jgi:hypothetical protein